MKQELIEQRKKLENDLLKLNAKINLEILRDDVSAIDVITDQLNSLFQDNIVVKYGNSNRHDHIGTATDLIYEAMQIMDKASVELQIDIQEIESEMESEK
jgi:6-phosphogluconate dehydrogenase (decarboxylating)